MEQSKDLGLHINIASHQLRRTLSNLFAQYGLTGIQSRILGYLGAAAAKGNDVYQRDIEKNFGIRRSSVTSVITNLERSGFVTRQPVPGDARLKKLTLTEKGTETNRLIGRSVAAFEDTLRDCLTPQEQELLLQILHKIIEKLDDPSSCKHCTKNFEQGKDETLC